MSSKVWSTCSHEGVYWSKARRRSRPRCRPSWPIGPRSCATSSPKSSPRQTTSSSRSTSRARRSPTKELRPPSRQPSRRPRSSRWPQARRRVSSASICCSTCWRSRRRPTPSRPRGQRGDDEVGARRRLRQAGGRLRVQDDGRSVQRPHQSLPRVPGRHQGRQPGDGGPRRAQGAHRAALKNRARRPSRRRSGGRRHRRRGQAQGRRHRRHAVPRARSSSSRRSSSRRRS